MKLFLTRLFSLRPNELVLVLPLGLILWSNSLAVQISYIASVSGFLNKVGVNQFLVVSIVTYIIILGVLSLKSLIIDRLSRVNVMGGMTFSFAMVFVLLRLLFVFRFPDWLNYSFFYLLAELQWLFFPLVFWIFANSIFNMAEAKRLFPLIAAWGFLGKLLGIGIATIAPGVFADLGVDPEELILVNVLFYLFSYILVKVFLSSTQSHDQTIYQPESVQDTLTECFNFIKEVRSFRFLTWSILIFSACDILIEFRFYDISDNAFTTLGEYQTFYGLYRLAMTLLSFTIQTFLTGKILTYFNLKDTFLIMPFTMLTSLILLLISPNLVGGVGAILLARLSWDTIDESARKSFQALVPEERRGRVSIFMDGYLLAIGTILGSGVTGIVILLGHVLPFSTFYGYIGIGVLAAFLGIWSIFQMRVVYENSLLNWRLTRRSKAKSVLDKLNI
ncbi:hypothetical protein K4A83_09125 [Spirulina subsalsa FACHB-351]|uniref:ADP,ATP carrier protein n=1 Tax=Spirulina subsalsa FACHB-351 TaxID=234711 RepID=A0ABT3L601_9CYAN|nr:hypothetical protein [Spirulina subsalsa]MCW6036430.1 hypothetical protein [Spirulina subsalsa FACHB-351]